MSLRNRRFTISFSFPNPVWHLLHWRQVREERASAKRIARFKAEMLSDLNPVPGYVYSKIERFNGRVPRPPKGWGGDAAYELLDIEKERPERVVVHA